MPRLKSSTLAYFTFVKLYYFRFFLQDKWLFLEPSEMLNKAAFINFTEKMSKDVKFRTIVPPKTQTDIENCKIIIISIIFVSISYNSEIHLFSFRNSFRLNGPLFLFYS